MKKIEGKSIVSYEKICNKHKYDKHNITFSTHTHTLSLSDGCLCYFKDTMMLFYKSLKTNPPFLRSDIKVAPGPIKIIPGETMVSGQIKIILHEIKEMCALVMYQTKG